MRETIQAAIDYIEAHLTEDIDVHDVAARASISAFHFQRVFSAVCGLPFGEYLRRRRLTLAAQELMGAIMQMGAAVASIMYASFARETRWLSQTGRITEPTARQLK